MSDPHGYLRVLDSLLMQAGREAQALRLNTVGPEDYILAILATDEDSAARATLEHFGITHDSLAETLAAEIATWDPPAEDYDESAGLHINPAGYEMIGRAEGIALGFGAPAVTKEHVLIAFLWSDSGRVEWHWGTTREAVLHHLEQLGVQIPAVPLPIPRRPSTRCVFVPYDELMTIVNTLTTTLPRGSGIAFNHDGESRAWVFSYPEVDLKRHVGEILDKLGVEPDPQPETP